MAHRAATCVVRLFLYVQLRLDTARAMAGIRVDAGSANDSPPEHTATLLLVGQILVTPEADFANTCLTYRMELLGTRNKFNTSFSGQSKMTYRTKRVSTAALSTALVGRLPVVPPIGALETGAWSEGGEDVA